MKGEGGGAVINQPAPRSPVTRNTLFAAVRLPLLMNRQQVIN